MGAQRATQLLGRAAARLVVCHLGGGSSVTAVGNGRSVDTTMGFSPLEGVPMNTRSGSVDPGALIFSARDGLSADEADQCSTSNPGSRASGTDRTRRGRGSGRGWRSSAELAYAVFEHRVGGAVAAMAAAAGGIDALLFTAGMGEGSSRVRENVCRRLRFLGVELDRDANDRAVPDCDVSTSGSTVRVLLLAAREEVIAARAARKDAAGNHPILNDRGSFARASSRRPLSDPRIEVWEAATRWRAPRGSRLAANPQSRFG